MKYFLIAGEASGDLHASNLINALQRSDNDADFAFIGGDMMTRAAGKAPLHHFRMMNFMGLWAVLKNIFTLQRILKNTKQAISEFSPDAVILVDYAGFNMRIAKFASLNGFKVFYYISPKVWAWRKSRVKSLKKFVSRMFVIFPFEVGFFSENGMEVEYFGNPLVDAIGDFNETKPPAEMILQKIDDNTLPVVALLAGSRKQEIAHCLPEMISASRQFPGYRFVVAGAPSVDHSVYTKLLEGTEVKIVYNMTYPLLSVAAAAIVTSGTATLETALLNVPQVVVYKTGKLTYRIGKLFVNFRFFSLVNLISDREVVKEILQFDLSENIRKELDRILNEPDYRLKMVQGYAEIKDQIGEKGVSVRIADKMVELLRKGM